MFLAKISVHASVQTVQKLLLDTRSSKTQHSCLCSHELILRTHIYDPCLMAIVDILAKKHGVNVCVFETNWNAESSGHMDDATQVVWRRISRWSPRLA